MNPLRKKFDDFLRFRCLSERTRHAYVRAVSDLAQHCRRSPEQICDDEIIQYINYLADEKSLSFSSCNVALSTFKCFYNQFLGNGTLTIRIPVRKAPKRLPVVMDREEVRRLIQATLHPQKRMFLMVAYGSGLRLGELMNLKVEDIDSSRKSIFVRSGKGRKDRYTLLPDSLLENLRSYYQMYRPQSWLFYSKRTDNPVRKDRIQKAYTESKRRAKITKQEGIHTLRHCFATHLLEDGVDIKTVQHLLGHADISSTTVYLHVSGRLISKVISPLDTISDIKDSVDSVFMHNAGRKP